jgi:hypothetical protein
MALSFRWGGLAVGGVDRITESLLLGTRRLLSAPIGSGYIHLNSPKVFMFNLLMIWNAFYDRPRYQPCAGWWP